MARYTIKSYGQGPNLKPFTVGTTDSARDALQIYRDACEVATSVWVLDGNTRMKDGELGRRAREEASGAVPATVVPGVKADS